MERNGSDDEGQVQGQVYRPWYVYINLNTDKKIQQLLRACLLFRVIMNLLMCSEEE